MTVTLWTVIVTVTETIVLEFLIEGESTRVSESTKLLRTQLNLFHWKVIRTLFPTTTLTFTLIVATSRHPERLLIRTIPLMLIVVLMFSFPRILQILRQILTYLKIPKSFRRSRTTTILIRVPFWIIFPLITSSLMVIISNTLTAILIELIRQVNFVEVLMRQKKILKLPGTRKKQEWFLNLTFHWL